MGLPTQYVDRIAQDVQPMEDGNLPPMPEHTRLRYYAIEAAEDMKRKDNQRIEAEWEELQKESDRIAKLCEGRTEEIRRSLPEHAQRMWGNANLGFIERILKEADPANGENLANFICGGVPAVATFPRTTLFQDFSPEQLSSYEKHQREAEKRFKIKEKTKRPDWVTTDDLKHAFETFIKKARGPVEVNAGFDEVQDPVYCFPREEGPILGERLRSCRIRFWGYGARGRCQGSN